MDGVGRSEDDVRGRVVAMRGSSDGVGVVRVGGK